MNVSVSQVRCRAVDRAVLGVDLGGDLLFEFFRSNTLEKHPDTEIPFFNSIREFDNKMLYSFLSTSVHSSELDMNNFVRSLRMSLHRNRDQGFRVFGTVSPLEIAFPWTKC